jgi:hypothetical protein
VPLRYDLFYRLEPRRPFGDLDAGFRAAVSDPLWFLARQWQLGEHQGQDAGSPAQISYTAQQLPIDPYDGDPALDPQVTPPEVIVEAEPGDWWTTGRRIRLGLAAADQLPAGLTPDQDAALRLGDLAPPYDGFSGSVDGLACYQARAELGLPDTLFAEVPDRVAADLWDPAELVYTASFSTGQGSGPVLEIPRHDGGDLDWYSVHSPAAADNAAWPAGAAVTLSGTMLPNRLQYPGAPQPRWWQIEDAKVDIGGFPPDRSHLATMLLIDLVVSHADDWFSFPVAGTAGTVLSVGSVKIRDTFDDGIDAVSPADWTMFDVTGLPGSTLVLWPTVATPLTGQVLDDIVLGVDEDANLLWAVERRSGARELAPPPAQSTDPGPAPTGQLAADAPKIYAYQPSSSVPAYWHPYEIHEIPQIDGQERRRFVQSRLADLRTRPPTLMPAPVSDLLADPAAPAAGPVHQIEPATVPVMGLRLERRYVLGRASDGTPRLWRQRRRLPLLTPPVSGLRFDILEQQAQLS